MLQGVTPFSRWEKELPKLITDPRWSAVGSLKDRRLIFDEYCKTSADEHKRAKAERARRGREEFQALLEEAAAVAGAFFSHSSVLALLSAHEGSGQGGSFGAPGRGSCCCSCLVRSCLCCSLVLHSGFCRCCLDRIE